ncbi:MAG: hypothetical protein FVQ85_11980 [Planctomycetes bacterium]|nr:hypothetical protein [Planctomycetota bacterium]
MSAMILAGCGAPQSFYSYKEQTRKEWIAAISGWRRKAIVSTGHDEGTAGGGFSDFAQSFIPCSDIINAVELTTYPVKAAGWIRVDLAKDENGRPGKVLSRTWLRVETDCPAGHSSFMTFDVPNVKVDPEGVYWITFNEFVDEEYVGKWGTSMVTNTGFSKDDTYQGGKLIVGNHRGTHESGDSKFRIISKCGTLPTLRKASRGERQTLPAKQFQEASWSNASIKWCEYVLEKQEAQEHSSYEKIKRQR